MQIRKVEEGRGEGERGRELEGGVWANEINIRKVEPSFGGKKVIDWGKNSERMN